MKALVDQANAKYVPTQQSIAATGTEVPLPSPPASFTVTNAGWRLAFWFPELRKVGLFNLATLKFDGFVDSAEEQTQTASGGSVLAVYQPVSRTLDLYDVNTLQKRVTHVFSESAKVRAITMGLHQPMQIFALMERNIGYDLGVLTLPNRTFLTLEVKPSRPGASSLSRAGSNLYASSDDSGQYLIATRPDVGPSGLGTYSLQPNGTALHDYKHASARFPRIMGKGQRVVANEGQFYADPTEGFKYNQNSNRRGASIHGPVVGYEATLTYYQDSSKNGFTGFRVNSISNDSPIIELSVDKMVHGKVPSTHSGAILGSAPADRIICIHPSEKKLIFFPLGLRGGTGTASLAEPGKLFEKKMELPAGATMTLENGPEGLTLDPASFTLRWQVPPTQPRGQSVQVLILVKKPDGTQDYHIEKIPVP